MINSTNAFIDTTEKLESSLDLEKSEETIIEDGLGSFSTADREGTNVINLLDIDPSQKEIMDNSSETETNTRGEDLASEVGSGVSTDKGGNEESSKDLPVDTIPCQKEIVDNSSVTEANNKGKDMSSEVGVSSDKGEKDKFSKEPPAGDKVTEKRKAGSPLDHINKKFDKPSKFPTPGTRVRAWKEGEEKAVYYVKSKQDKNPNGGCFNCTDVQGVKISVNFNKYLWEEITVLSGDNPPALPPRRHSIGSRGKDFDSPPPPLTPQLDGKTVIPRSNDAF